MALKFRGQAGQRSKFESHKYEATKRVNTDKKEIGSRNKPWFTPM